MTWGGIIVAIIVGVLVYNKWIKTDYSKPWWEGEQLVYACKAPYYDKSECYKLTAVSDGEAPVRLKFNNGGYFDTWGATCHQAADEKIGRFCQFTEQGNRWDLLPITN